jgi:hypothetical protein
MTSNSNPVLIVEGKKVEKSELIRIFSDLVHFGVQWDEDGNTFVYNYLDNRYELFSDRVFDKYLNARRKQIQVNLRGKRAWALIQAIRHLAIEMRVSKKWFPQDGDVTRIEVDDNMPEMEWETL